MQTTNGTPNNRSIARANQPLTTALTCLFGLPESQLQQWPGILAYGQHLQKCFVPLLHTDYAGVWSELERPSPKTTLDCWPFFEAVVTKLHSLNGRTDSSIYEIWNDVVPRESTSPGANSIIERTPPPACAIALFAVLCWSSMTLQPCLMQSTDADFPSLRVHGIKLGQKMEFVERPIPKLFRNLQRTMKTKRWQRAIGRDAAGRSTALLVPSLNYASLHTIGKIRLAWVGDLTSHLDFDAAKRQLSIFKFPSFCALTTLSDRNLPCTLAG
jgi:hypothetical protein